MLVLLKVAFTPLNDLSILAEQETESWTTLSRNQLVSTLW